MPFDMGENVHKWMKVNLVIQVLFQVFGSEKKFHSLAYFYF